MSAKKYRHNQVDIEHLLLTVIKEPDGTIAQIANETSINLEKAEERLDLLLRSKSKSILFGPKDTIFVTSKVKKVLDKSEAEAKCLGDKDVLIEHVLLAILSEAKTITTQVFGEAKTTYEKVVGAIKLIREKNAQ